MIINQKDLDDFLKAKEKMALPPLPPEAMWDNDNEGGGSSGSDPDSPPPYAQATSSARRSRFSNALSVSVITPAPLRPSNFLKIHRPSLSVKGTWLIDSSLRVPQGLLEPLQKWETVRPNLCLSSEYCPVHAEVYVQGTSRALLSVESSSNSVSIRVPRRTQHVYIVAKSKYNSIDIYLPDDFCGPIHWKIKYNTVKFSSAVQQSLTYFGQSDGMEHGFIGKYVGSGYGETDEEWTGDEAHAETTMGRQMKFHFVSETKKLEKPRYRT